MPRRPRTFTHYHRQRLERAAEHYLHACYRGKTAARASEFATTFLAVTAPYLSRVVSEITGISLHQYLRAKQIAYAEQLLKTTPLTIEEIALRCGFGTARTFYRRFRESHGLTPAAFRRL